MALKLSDYVSNIKNAANTIAEGMAVTMSYMFKALNRSTSGPHGRPACSKLPDRYRGFLEVDMDICIACLACERACPIDCIKIDAKKDPETRRSLRLVSI